MVRQHFHFEQDGELMVSSDRIAVLSHGDDTVIGN
jgi:hypothetical protein